MVRNLQAAPAVAAEPAKKPVTVEPQPAVENKPAEDPAPVEAAPAEPAAEAPEKEYTEVDVRAAMDAARKRIEGENYKEKPDSEGYKKWHRVLTVWFKNAAAMFGAEKPSALPDSESRYKFIRCCEAVFVNDAGELDSDCPF
ncbi:MAG: hypothetical protein J6J71_02840 [Prevotella sp.]|nr:hypothetical protein [Prevotella sp.]